MEYLENGPPEQKTVKVSLTASGPDFTSAYLHINDSEIGCVVEVVEVRVAAGEMNKVTLALNPDELELDIPAEMLRIQRPGRRRFLRGRR